MTDGSQASSTSKSPICPGERPASSSAVATPQAMFEPARLWTTGRPSRSSAAATIAAVVVLPLVAEISTEPSSRPAPMRPSARGERASSSRPGAVVPPLLPSLPAHGPHQTGERPSGAVHQVVAGGTMTRRQRGSTVTVAGVAAIGSPSA